MCTMHIAWRRFFLFEEGDIGRQGGMAVGQGKNLCLFEGGGDELAT